MQRAVAVINEACGALGFLPFQREPLLILGLWAESKSSFNPIGRIGDLVRMVESLAERRAEWRGMQVKYVVPENPPVTAEYGLAEVPIHGRTVSLWRCSRSSCDDLSDGLGKAEMHRNRRELRRLVRLQKLLTASQFCNHAGVTRRELHQRERLRTVIKVFVANRPYYPALHARAGRLGFRLARVSSALSAGADPWTVHFELAHRFESLGNKTLLQTMQRGAGFRVALRYARDVSNSRTLGHSLLSHARRQDDPLYMC